MGSIEGNVQDEPTTEIHKTQSAEGATKADTTEKVTDYAENSGIASGKTKWEQITYCVTYSRMTGI